MGCNEPIPKFNLPLKSHPKLRTDCAESRNITPKLVWLMCPETKGDAQRKTLEFKQF